MSFLVLGLPRSRTAWLANFLTYDGLFCYHEGLNGCNSIGDYVDKIGTNGDSNTGLMFFDFEPYFKDSKIIVIDSDIDKSIKFAKKVFKEDISDAMAIAKASLDKIKGLHIKYEEINDRLDAIWSYVSDKPMNKKRAENLTKLNIQVNDPFDLDIFAMNNFKESIDACIT